MPILENNQTCLTDPPSPEDLMLLFERFMAYWYGEPVRLTGLQGASFSPESPEFTVEWFGMSPGRLNVRFDARFYLWLVHKRDFKRINLYTENELLKEITALYGLYLIRYFSMVDLAETGPILPRRQALAELPDRDPDSQIILKVERCPVEIKLWLQTSNPSV